jgi:hypothetical protein
MRFAWKAWVGSYDALLLSVPRAESLSNESSHARLQAIDSLIICISGQSFKADEHVEIEDPATLSLAEAILI